MIADARSERLEALNCLSLARTALDDPSELPGDDPVHLKVTERMDAAGDRAVLAQYAIEKIDEAMRLLGADEVAS